MTLERQKPHNYSCKTIDILLRNCDYVYILAQFYLFVNTFLSKISQFVKLSK